MPRPRRTPKSTVVFQLPGGTEDNDLWVEQAVDQNGHTVLCSTWELTEEERQQIADGQNIELLIWGTQHPPVAVRTTDVQLGRGDGDG